MSVTENTFTLNNQPVRYYEAGLHHSRTLLLLHGGIGDAKQNWHTIIPQLAEDYHILAPDLPGFGGTARLSGQTDLSALITWLFEFLQSQDVEQVVVVGNSFGALLARLMATQYPHHVAAIVLMNGGFLPDVPPTAKILMRLPIVGGIFTQVIARLATSADSLNDMIHHPEAVTPDLIANAKLNTNGFAHLMQMAARQAFSEDNKPLVSSLILWGVEDGSTSLREGNKLKDALGGAQLIEIEGCGHLPHLEEPDIFEWQVKNFLAKHDPVKKATIPGV